MKEAIASHSVGSSSESSCKSPNPEAVSCEDSDKTEVSGDVDVVNLEFHPEPLVSKIVLGKFVSIQKAPGL